jgi:CBS domain-containing membrane protein
MSLFQPILAGATGRDRAVACLGAFLGIAIVTVAGLMMGASPALVAPMGASVVLLFVTPASPLAQPWPVIGGNVISAAFGVFVAAHVPHPALGAAIAVAGAIAIMSLARCLHPPGGAAALLPVLGGPSVAASGYGFALAPVGLDALLLVGAGIVFHRWSGHAYPHRPAPVTPAKSPQFQPEDIDAALAELGETFDVAREDLDILLQLAEQHARDRRIGQPASSARRSSRPPTYR